MRTLIRFDAYILGKFEKFTQNWQKLTGLTNFWWARQVTVLFVVYLMYLPFTYVKDSLPLWENVRTVVFFAAFYMLTVGWDKLKIANTFDKQEQQAFARLRQGLANPKKIDPENTTRIGLVIFSGCLLAWLQMVFTDHLYFAALFVHHFCREYLRACDPLPPDSSKLGQWLKNLRLKLSLSQPAAAPVKT